MKFTMTLCCPMAGDVRVVAAVKSRAVLRKVATPVRVEVPSYLLTISLLRDTGYFG